LKVDHLGVYQPESEHPTQESIVTTRDERRKAAVHGYEERAAAEQKRKANVAATLEQKQQQMRQAENVWMTKAVPTIRAGVQASGEAFARLGSRYVIGGANDTSPYSIAYRVSPSGRPTQTEVTFIFAFAEGYVSPDTSARGCDKFPGSVPVDNVTQDWVEDVADSVMDAVLGGQRMRVEDD
jgi:hypothetical protein